jgi:hypothetical protein
LTRQDPSAKQRRTLDGNLPRPTPPPCPDDGPYFRFSFRARL